MIALDVYYHPDRTTAVGICFKSWEDPTPSRELVEVLPQAAPYVPGEFYKREMPPLLHVIRALDPPDVVIVDGFVWLDGGRPGLGARLHEVLGVPVVGIAKNPYVGSPGVEVSRHGTRPLWVTAAGMPVADAAAAVQRMHGPYRIPTLLKRVDQLSRG